MKIFTTLVFLGGLPASVHAADIGVVGLFPGKAVIVVDGNSPKIFAVGSSVTDGVKLVAVKLVPYGRDRREQLGGRGRRGVGCHLRIRHCSPRCFYDLIDGAAPASQGCVRNEVVCLVRRV